MMSIRHAAGIAMLAAIAVAAHCGPSLQTLYRGDAEFEHCYALDEFPTVAMHEKARCWHQWSTFYTYGQTRDRVLYADARYHALSRIPHIPTDEAMMLAAPGEGTGTKAVSAPAPQSAFSSPPSTQMDRHDGGSH